MCARCLGRGAADAGAGRGPGRGPRKPASADFCFMSFYGSCVLLLLMCLVYLIVFIIVVFVSSV